MKLLLVCCAAALGFSRAAWCQPEDLAAKSQRARQAMNARQYEDAAVLYQQLVKALPDNAGMRMNLGLALQSAGRYTEAIPEFQAVVKQQPKFAAAHLLLGLAYLKLNRPLEAIGPLSSALDSEPSNRMARLELADALLRTGRPEQATRQFRILTEADPHAPKPWQGLGLSYIASAQKAFADVERTDPASAYADVLFANSLVRRGRYYSAFRAYRDALAKAPALPGVHAGLAEVYRNTGHADWAGIEEIRERGMAPPKCPGPACDFQAGRYQDLAGRSNQKPNAELRYWQSLAYSRLADGAFERLMQLPPSPEIYDLMADAFRLQGRFDKAAAAWEKAVALAPDDRRLSRNLAVALSLAGDDVRARPMLQQLLRAEPESPELNLEYGEALLRTDAAEDAIPYLDTAARLTPKSLRAHAALGTALMRVGRAADALPHLRTALPMDEDGKIHYQAAQACLKTDRQKEAEELLIEFHQLTARLRAQRLPSDAEITAP